RTEQLDPERCAMLDPATVLTRRRLLQFGGAGYLGLNLGGLWRAQAAPRPSVPTGTPIRACILLFYYGGPRPPDTYHLQPDVPCAALPFPFHNVVEVPCQGGGFLGSAYDPLRVEMTPDARGYQLGVLRAEGVEAVRLGQRRRLLRQVERAGPGDGKLRGLYE